MTNFFKPKQEMISFLIIFVLAGLAQSSFGQNTEAHFEELKKSENWSMVFSDEGTGKWHDNWFLDGKIAKVENTKNGMHLQAGPEFRNNAHHMVLWTKQSFEGNMKIEFDYTRTDNETKAVNIIYIQATGKEEGEFVKDIFEWRHLREIPAMRNYFDNMNTWHISFAAFPNNEEVTDYLRARRYPVISESSFSNTEVEPTFINSGLFKTGITYRITIIKTDSHLFFESRGDDMTKLFSWNISEFTPINEGRIGIRHMFTRSALYKNFKAWSK